jgi:hypothetical protein
MSGDPFDYTYNFNISIFLGYGFELSGGITQLSTNGALLKAFWGWI